MSNSTIKLRRSSVSGRYPDSTQLELGEVAINTHDGKMFFKQDAAGNTSIIEVGRKDATDQVWYVATSGSDSNDGESIGTAFASINRALEVAASSSNGTIFLKSGEYILDNDSGGVDVPQNISIVGDNHRSTIVRGSNANNDLFYVRSNTYVTGIGFKDHQYGAAAISFNPDGSAGNIQNSPYIQDCSSITTSGVGMRIDGSKATGLRSMVAHSFTQINTGISNKNPNGVAALQNNRTWIQEETIGWIDAQIAAGTGIWSGFTYNSDICYRDVGLIIDSIVKDLSGSVFGAIEQNFSTNIAAKRYFDANGISNVSGQIDQTVQAIEYAASLALNALSKTAPTNTYSATSQDTSHDTVETGVDTFVQARFDIITEYIDGTTPLSESVSSGGKGVHLLNRGYAQLVSIFTISCDVGILAESGGQCSISASNCSFGNYGLRATGSSALLYSGTIDQNATAGSTTIVVTGLTEKPKFGDAVQFGGTGDYFSVRGATELSGTNGDTSTVTLEQGLPSALSATTAVEFYQRSFISAANHTFEYVGTGVDAVFNTPRNGGIPIQEYEVYEDDNNLGSVYFTSTDHNGDFRIGNDLVINRTTGTIEGQTFDRSLFAVLTPYILALES
jgi:hypothetical protein